LPRLFEKESPRQVMFEHNFIRTRGIVEDQIMSGHKYSYDESRKEILRLQRDPYELYMRSHRVYAVLVDTNMDGVLFSVACIVDGTFSLYGENGCILGYADKFKELAMASRAFVYGAEQVIPASAETKNTDLPADGERIFYLMTDGVIYKAISRKGSMSKEPVEIQVINLIFDKVLGKYFEHAGDQ
jgi:hypothetical protein